MAEAFGFEGIVGIADGPGCQHPDISSKSTVLERCSSVSRVLKIPEPKCFVLGYGDSTVNLELRAWIDDPKNDIDNVKDPVLMAVWESFHANGITIAFPQRDLHIKSVVPLEIKSGP